MDKRHAPAPARRGRDGDQHRRMYIVPLRIVNVVSIAPRFRGHGPDGSTLAVSRDGIEEL